MPHEQLRVPSRASGTRFPALSPSRVLLAPAPRPVAQVCSRSPGALALFFVHLLSEPRSCHSDGPARADRAALAPSIMRARIVDDFQTAKFRDAEIGEHKKALLVPPSFCPFRGLGGFRPNRSRQVTLALIKRRDKVALLVFWSLFREPVSFA